MACLQGSAPPSPDDRAVLSEGMLRDGLRLACKLRPKTAVTVEVQSRFDLRAAPALTRIDTAGALPREVDLAGVLLGARGAAEAADPLAVAVRRVPLERPVPQAEASAVMDTGRWSIEAPPMECLCEWRDESEP